MSFPNPRTRPRRTRASNKIGPESFLKRLDEGRMIDRNLATKTSRSSIPVPEVLARLLKKGTHP